ncbi:MAG: winged helix-turn-helix transcriptional regulator, partial [Geobacter sp.]|nr:winged helix-turn-helix transcriptional regulator [Geobacter sp.]
NPQHLIAPFTEQDAKAKQGVAAQKTPVKTPVKISDATAQIGTSLSATQETTQETTQEKIMTLLEHQPGITRKVLAVQVGISADGIKYHLEKLKAAGKIRHVGPTKKGHWEIIKNA